MKGSPTGAANSSVYVQVAPIRISSIYSVAKGIILTRSARDRKEMRRVWRVVLEFGESLLRSAIIHASRFRPQVKKHVTMCTKHVIR